MHVKKIFIRSSLCRQRCEKHDVNLHNQNINIIHISIQPHFDQYTTSLSGNPLPKVIALVMAWGFIWTWDISVLPMQFDEYFSLPRFDNTKVKTVTNNIIGALQCRPCLQNSIAPNGISLDSVMLSLKPVCTGNIYIIHYVNLGLNKMILGLMYTFWAS